MDLRHCDVVELLADETLVGAAQLVVARPGRTPTRGRLAASTSPFCIQSLKAFDREMGVIQVDRSRCFPAELVPPAVGPHAA